MARTARENVREKILEAAETRLWRYGLKKTTIDEIAADAGVGKGTVYLYFESKEDIVLAIIAEYKLESLEQQEAIARDHNLGTMEKIRQFLLLPVLNSCVRCRDNPAALDIIMTIRPHIIQRVRPYFEQEVAILATILEEGNRHGVLSVPDTLRAARTLKTMTLSLMPSHYFVNEEIEIRQEIDAIVELAYNGLKK